jgi:hypothetical protein
MKVTKYALIAIFIILLGCESDDDKQFTNESGTFVRFFLQLDRDNNPLESPVIDLGSTGVSTYEKADFKTLKIPVALTQIPSTETVKIFYEAEISGIDNVDIRPQESLSFTGNQLVDTLYVNINERWDSSLNPSLTLRLTGSSDENVVIGMPNENLPLDQLTVNFNNVDTTYGVQPPTRIDITGNAAEFYQLNIEFPNGYIENEVDQNSLLSETQSNFNYTLTPLPLIADDLISYSFTIDENFNDDDLLYKTTLALNNLVDYELTGFPLVSYLRNPLTDRDPTLNTASLFYNTSDSFYRLFGVNWMDFNEDGLCEWRDFNAFSVPIEVPQDDPNAILGDDSGTADTSDDIYYHAFRVGFKPPNNNTTNSFNLRRWFTNESTSALNSPGFNVSPALEFFPDTTAGTLSGTVQVVEQTIQIGTTASNGSLRFFITISGSGTYTEIAPGIIDIDLTLNATNNELFGGTRTARYHLYNTSNFTDPPLLMESCFTPITLQ